MEFCFSESRHNQNVRDIDEDEGFTSKTLKLWISKHFHTSLKQNLPCQLSHWIQSIRKENLLLRHEILPSSFWFGQVLTLIKTLLLVLIYIYLYISKSLHFLWLELVTIQLSLYHQSKSSFHDTFNRSALLSHQLIFSFLMMNWLLFSHQ